MICRLCTGQRCVCADLRAHRQNGPIPDFVPDFGPADESSVVRLVLIEPKRFGRYASSHHRNWTESPSNRDGSPPAGGWSGTLTKWRWPKKAQEHKERAMEILRFRWVERSHPTVLLWLSRLMILSSILRLDW